MTVARSSSCAKVDGPETYYELHGSPSYAASAPRPQGFQDLVAKCAAAAPAPLPWTADDLRALRTPTLLVIGDHDFVRIEHAAGMRGLIPDARPAVLPGTTRMALMRRSALLLPLLGEFLDGPFRTPTGRSAS
ncbi:hypothetical protein [Streptomyces sp. NPDC020362]|uniref:alpha/beta fold hydrolase n=1 Tax=unclassified Streptomyces TaxID=2593676 RepID=UPI0033D4950F